MNYENLLLDSVDGIVTITINREKALNALNAQTLRELRHFFGEAGPELTDLKGVILTGAGTKAFVAGADITEFRDLSAEQGVAFARNGQEVFFLIERFPKPVVAAVNGFALGGGCELAMACHLRIAGEKARFGQPEVNLGLIPGYGGTQRLVQYIGKAKAMELTLTADMIDAQEAYRLGLVNAVAPQGEEVANAIALLGKITTKAPIAVQKAIEAINAYYQDGVDGFEAELKAFGDCCATDDFKEGAAAFLEKRAAVFTGK